MKYFLFGAFSSAIMVYGISLYYGATGTTHLAAACRRSWADADPVPRSYPAGLRLQGIPGPHALLGARRVRGRADAGDDLPVRGPQARHLRGTCPRIRRDLPATSLRPDFAVLYYGRSNDDDRELHRTLPDRCQTPARLLFNRPGRIPAHRPRRRNAARTARA